MTLFLIRHGETETSGHTYAGRSDARLTPRGREQAQEIARQLCHHPITCVISSPLSRAMDTAYPLAAARGLRPRVEPFLVEFDFGVLEGQPKQALGLALRKAHARIPVEGGESLLDVWERVGRVLARLATDLSGPDTAIAVIGHFWVNRLIWGRVMGLDFDAACRAKSYRPQTGTVMPLTVCRAVAEFGPEAN